MTLAQSDTPIPSASVVAAICAAEILGLAGFSIEPVLIHISGDLSCTKAGFANLAHLTSRLCVFSQRSIRVDCKQVATIDHNMAAPLAALVAKLQSQDCRVAFENLSSANHHALQEAGFLSRRARDPGSNNYRYGRSDLYDHRRDRPVPSGRDWPVSVGLHVEHPPGTKGYRTFALADARKFAAYAAVSLATADISYLPSLFRRRLLQAVNEIFSNASIHSKSSFGVFVICNGNGRRIEFTVVDLESEFRKQFIDSSDEGSLRLAL